MSVILPALQPAATAAYDAPTTLSSPPANRCHATVNLHCTYVTFCKLRCPWSRVINIGRGNWMLIGGTIDQSSGENSEERFDDPSHIDKQTCGPRETIAVWPRPFIIIIIGCLWRQRVLSSLSGRPRATRLRNKNPFVSSSFFFFLGWQACTSIIFLYLKKDGVMLHFKKSIQIKAIHYI